MKRRPTASVSLQRILRSVPKALDNVIDVGVQSKTDYLVDAAPHGFHHLFEPADNYHDVIEREYTNRHIEHRLYPVAVSDTSGEMFLHKLSNDRSGRITHTQLLPERHEDRNNLVAVSELAVVTLDETFPEGSLSALEYIVKVDVDGIEEKIIAGGKRVISNAAAVAIEAPLGALFTRSRMLVELGHRLFDICELCYYDDALWQVDLIFVHNKLLEQHPELAPLPLAQRSGGLNMDLWYPLNRDL